MTKQELIKNAIPYFEKASINVMHATEDGNFFHKHDRHYAFGHVSGTNMQVFTITREDLEDKPKKDETVKVNDTEYNLEGLKAVCDEKEIKYVQNIGLKKLGIKLEEKIKEEKAKAKTKVKADAKKKEEETEEDKENENLKEETEKENSEKETEKTDE